MTSVAWSQGVTGSAVTGTITEEGTGATVEGAIVQLKNTSNGDTFNAVTDASGTYFIDNVTPGGPYLLTINAPGYKLASKNGVQLALGQRLKVDQVMSFQVEEIVIVEQIDPLADKGRTGPSTTLNESTMNKLPLQGRNFTDLVSQAPQVNGNSFAGQNNRYNNIQIDGGANNDLFGLAANGTPGGQANAKPISIEAIKEFVVQVAPFDVRQGSFTGGLVNAITKSGTNEFHGGLFGYFQNRDLAGKRDDPTFLKYSTWQFGGEVGGPIVEDKAHFFASVDLQVRNQSFGNQFQLTGDPTHDMTAAGFTKAEVDRFRDILANKYGFSNPGDETAPKLDNPDRNVFVKVTTSVIPDSRLELSYNLVDANQDVLIRAPTSPSIPGRLRDGYELSNSGYGQANTTHTVRAKLTTNWGDFSNEFLGGVSLVRDERQMPNTLPLILVKAGKLGAADSWLAAGGERFSHQNILDQDVYQVQDNVSWGGLTDHRFTIGTSNEFFKIRNVFFQAAYGVWAFNSLDDLDNNIPAAYQRRFGVANSGQDPGTAKFNVAQLGFYLQDEWSILKNLTLTPGVRMDVPFLSNANQNAVLLATAVDGGIDTSKVPSGNILWSPRLGVNWDVEGDAQTIVRGGAGIFSGRPPYVWVSNAYSINGLSQVELTCTTANMGKVPALTTDVNSLPSDCNGAGGVPVAPTNQGEIDYFDPDTKYPQNFRVSAGVDRHLPLGIVVSGDFLYTQDVNGWYTTDANLMDVGTSGDGRELYGTFAADPAKFTPTSTRLDNTNLRQAVKVFNKNGGRVYNATLQASKIFMKKYELDLGYTYSNSADRISLTSSQAFSNFQFAPVDGTLESRNVRPSAFDRRHKITATGAASFPYGFGAGLTYVGISGLPYTWTVNGDVNADGVNGNDIAFIPNSAEQISLDAMSNYADLAAFIDSQDCLKSSKGKFVERGACRNPWAHFVNLRLSWQSPAVKGQRLEVQFDIFNVLNLLNSDWGTVDQVTGFENAPSAFLRAVGYDATNNRPVYQFVKPTTITTTVFSPTQSRWRMQLGARYTF